MLTKVFERKSMDELIALGNGVAGVTRLKLQTITPNKASQTRSCWSKWQIVEGFFDL